jgi:hypothetical protein
MAPEPPVPAPLAPATPEPPPADEPAAPVPAPAESAQDAAPPADGEQPTEVMRRANDEQPGPTAGNGDAEALAQPTGEPREP